MLMTATMVILIRIIMMIYSMVKTDDKNPNDGMMLLKSNDEHA